MPVDEIAAAVGYQEPAFFRALFKRILSALQGLLPAPIAQNSAAVR